MKFRIPFRRTAIARLKNREKTVHCLFGKKRPFHSTGITVLIFLVHSMPHSKKYKRSFMFPFFVYRLLRLSFSGTKLFEAVLFEVGSRRIVSSTTIEFFSMLGPSQA